MSDAINHPRHYNAHPSGVEAIVLCEQLSFNVGNAIKYLFRLGHKAGAPPSEDLRKAQFYIRAEIQRLDEIRNRANRGNTITRTRNLRLLIEEDERYLATLDLAGKVYGSYVALGTPRDALFELLGALYLGADSENISEVDLTSRLRTAERRLVACTAAMDGDGK